jgi:PAS domain S-box-containing protein
MEKQDLISSKLKTALIGTILLYGLYLTSRHNYLLFHSISEIFSIVIACGIFMVAWNSRFIAKNNYMLFIGIAYLFMAFLDLMHTLAYKGMGVFQGHGINAAVQLWISTRSMESISLLAAPLLIGRNIRAKTIFTAYTVVTSLILGAIFYWDIFPVCFVEGSGLTPFKKISEYIICLTLGLSIFVLYKKQKAFDKTVFRLLTASIFVTILSEISFTFYIDLYGLSNVTGHYLKIISFYLIYKAIIESSLMNPYNLLFRDLIQSEELLRKSEKRYRILFEQAAVGVAQIISATGRFVNINQKYCDILGYSLSEMETLTFQEITHPDDVQADLDNMNLLIEGKIHEFTMEKRYIHKNGSVVWVNLAVSPMWKTQDKPNYHIAVVEDITDRKKTEEEQAKLRQRLEAQWETARMVDADLATLCSHILTEIVYMTGSTYGFYGLLSEDESLMTTYAWSQEVMKECRINQESFTFPVEQAGLWGNAIRKRKSIIVNNYEDYDHRNKKGIPDGHIPIKNFIAVPVFRQNRIAGIGAVANKSADFTSEDVQQVEAFLQSAQVIMEKKQAEDELERHRGHLMELVAERTSELQQVNRDLEQEIGERIRAEKQIKLMALFAELNPNPVLRFNVNGEVLMANRAAMDTLKISSLQDARIKSLLPGIEALDLTDCIYKGSILSHSAEIDDRYYHFIIKGLSDLGFGQIYSSDVTEQKRAEAETMRASHLASIGELAAGVAHEINNPINGIINYTQILANKSAPDSKERDITSRIIREGDRIANIVSNLLSFARDGKEKPGHVHISDIISDSLALTEAQIRKDGIRLNVDIQDPLPAIFVRAQEIQQVLLNLISNARHSLNEKFPEQQEGKVFDIMADKTVKDHNTYIRVTCLDRGAGIPDDIMNKVMNPFFTTKPTGIGTGLGLSISHGIITDHGGSIGIDSTEGEFTKVVFELPATNGKHTK